MRLADFAHHVTTRGTIRRGHEIQARTALGAALESRIPTGTLGWLATPREGELALSYVARAVATAEARSAWAGGLLPAAL